MKKVAFMTSSSENKSLKLYRASAGSGKTYRLSLEFLKLLVNDPYCYDKILAVTFTNKATTEMQTRIMADLFSVINGQDKKLFDTLKKELKKEYGTDMTDYDVKRNATRALFNILHDYSHFQVSTIDSFFQIILRNLAHELGLGAYLNIILDENDCLEDAIDLMLEEFRTDQTLRSWINDYSKEQINDSKNWNVKKDVFDFSKNIFKEVYKNHEKELEGKIFNREFLKKYREQLIILQKRKEKEILDVVSLFDDVLAKNGLTVNDLSNSMNGAYGYVKDQKEKKFSPISNRKRLMEALGNPEKWVTKTHPRRDEIKRLGETQLNPLILSIEEIRSKNILHINTCKLILTHINNLGLLCDVSKQVRSVNQMRGQFLLSDTPNLLKSMIDDSDTPFIYEKIGTVLEHIMIDEFQDTSQTQWGNFMPLVKECIDKNMTNLIVGDAKQSIYRFRNGDWSIIESLDDAFHGIKPSILVASDNWRSMENVIEFNNSIFSPSEGSDKAPILLPFENLVQGEHPLLKKFFGVYVNSHQNCSKTENKGMGFVEVEFVNNSIDEFGKMVMPALLLKRVTELQKNGVRASDITILTNRTKEMAEIADFFTNYRDRHQTEIDENGLCYDIISDEAFLLNSSSALNMIINAMRVSMDSSDKISMMNLYTDYCNILYKDQTEKQFSFTDLQYEQTPEFLTLKNLIEETRNLPLYEMVEELCRVLQLNRLEHQNSFLSKFMDELNEFITRKSPDVAMFLEYWDLYLKDKKIPLSDNATGIQVMTIHKSKGLEFHTVIIPYCDWDIYDSRHNSLLWCSTEGLDAPYNEIPILPVEFKKEMAESFFSADYDLERIQVLADNVNKLYVAFTRAVNNLIILSGTKEKNEKKENSDSEIKKCYDLLSTVLQDRLVPVNETEVLENELGVPHKVSVVTAKFSVGTVVSSQNASSEKEKEDNPFKEKPLPIVGTFDSYQRKVNFRNSNKASAYINGLMDCTPFTSEAIQKGVLLHYLFSNIVSIDDIPEASNRLLFEGFISTEKERQMLVKYATEKIQEHKEWFMPGLKIYNECSILSRDEETKRVKVSRPDRVIRKDNKMIIIDFKTGKRMRRHQKQVDEYAELLQKMGYETETHLWYLGEDEN